MELKDYDMNGLITQEQFSILQKAIADGRGIIVTGGCNTGMPRCSVGLPTGFIRVCTP